MGAGSECRLRSERYILSTGMIFSLDFVRFSHSIRTIIASGTVRYRVYSILVSHRLWSRDRLREKLTCWLLYTLLKELSRSEILRKKMRIQIYNQNSQKLKNKQIPTLQASDLKRPLTKRFLDLITNNGLPLQVTWSTKKLIIEKISQKMMSF